MIGDFGLGSVQRKVWQWSLQAFTSQPFTLQWATGLPLEMPATWQVKPEVGLPLLAKLWLLRQNLSGPFVYLDGNLILQGDLAEILVDLSPQKILVPQRFPLKSLKFFAVSVPDGGHSSSLTFKLDGPEQNYEELADLIDYSHNLCWPVWRPVPFGQNPDARLIDCTALQNRPWYRPFAPGHGLWLSQVKQAFQTGVLSWQDIQSDFADQKLHPGWWDKLDMALGNREFPEPPMEAMAVFVPREISVAPAPQQQLQDNHYPLPQRSRIRVLLSSYLWEVTLPTRLKRLFRPARAEER